jgi:hypothetical protein
MNTPQTISALIDAWPTITEFAAEVGCGYEAARQMRRRESIAPEHWERVIDAAGKRGIEGDSDGDVWMYIDDPVLHKISWIGKWIPESSKCIEPCNLNWKKCKVQRPEGI